MKARVAMIATLSAMTLALSACGEPGGEGSSSRSGFRVEAKAAAHKLLDQHTGVPKAPELPPLAAPPTPGALMTMISCSVPSCTALSKEFTTAAESLGWKVRVIVSQFTPESFTSAFDSALALNPDGLYYFPLFPADIVEAELDRAKKAGIPVITGSGDAKMGGDSPLVAITQSGQLEQYGQLEAAMVIADAKSTDGIAFMYPPGNAVYEQTFGAFEKSIKDAGGTVDSLEFSQEGVGTAVPGQVVSYLQSHPDTKYLIAASSAFTVGVVDAIKDAGIELPKIISFSTTEADAKSVSSGDIYGLVFSDVVTEQWQVVDFFARLLAGEQPDPELKDPLMVVTADNVDDFPGLPMPGFTQAYAAAFGAP
jgi:ABC-type sugar transport system substrate-binding protein